MVNYVSIAIKKIQCIKTIKGKERHKGEKTPYTPTNWMLALLLATERFSVSRQLKTYSGKPISKYLFLTFER